jgi:hypothetical protein
MQLKVWHKCKRDLYTPKTTEKVQNNIGLKKPSSKLNHLLLSEILLLPLLDQSGNFFIMLKMLISKLPLWKTLPVEAPSLLTVAICMLIKELHI